MAKPVTDSNASDPQVILTVAAARAEIGIPSTVVSAEIDADLRRQINDAAAWVGSQVSGPVLDAEHVDTLPPPDLSKTVGGRSYRSMPITVYDRRWVREVTRIDWWDEAGDLAEQPNQSILPANLGRTEIVDPGPFQDSLRVYPRSGGWPTTATALAYSTLRVHTVAGLDMTAAYATDIRRAVVEAARQLNGGYPSVRFNSIIEKVLAPFTSIA